MPPPPPPTHASNKLGASFLANTTLPPGSTIAVSSDSLTLLSLLVDEDHVASSQIRGELLNVIISTALYGSFAICAIASGYVLLRKGRKTLSTALLLLAIAATTACTTLYWALNNRDIFRDVAAFEAYHQGVLATLNCLPSSGLADNVTVSPCSSEDRGAVPTMVPDPLSNPSFNFCAGTVSLTVNTVLGDAIVWWRTTAIWYGNKTVRFVCAILLLATLAMGIVSTVHSCNAILSTNLQWKDAQKYANGLFFQPGSLFQGDRFGIAVSALSLATNMTATSLIGYKAWQHRILIRKHFRSMSGRSLVESVLRFLVESGLVYCVIWVIILVYQITTALYYQPSNLSQTTPVNQSFMLGLEVLTEAALTTVIAIYPMLVIIFVALEKSDYRSTSNNDRTAAGGLESLAFCPASSRTGETTTVIMASNTLPTPSSPAHSVERERAYGLSDASHT